MFRLKQCKITIYIFNDLMSFRMLKYIPMYFYKYAKFKKNNFRSK